MEQIFWGKKRIWTGTKTTLDPLGASQQLNNVMNIFFIMSFFSNINLRISIMIVQQQIKREFRSNSWKHVSNHQRTVLLCSIFCRNSILLWSAFLCLCYHVNYILVFFNLNSFYSLKFMRINLVWLFLHEWSELIKYKHSIVNVHSSVQKPRTLPWSKNISVRFGFGAMAMRCDTFDLVRNASGTGSSLTWKMKRKCAFSWSTISNEWIYHFIHTHKVYVVSYTVSYSSWDNRSNWYFKT